MESFIEILKIILPATAVFFAAFLIVKRFLDNDEKKRNDEHKKTNQLITIPLRLQAYERIIIFLERINPNSLVIRVNNPELNSHQFHLELIKTLKSEFEYNLSQQIYISQGAWELVKNSKEEIIKLVNLSANKVPHLNKSNDLAIMILNVTANLDKKLPTEIAIEYIKKEASKIF